MNCSQCQDPDKCCNPRLHDLRIGIMGIMGCLLALRNSGAPAGMLDMIDKQTRRVSDALKLCERR